MLINYIYAFRLNGYNIKIKSHFVLKHIMYSTTLYYKLILSFWKWFSHTNIYTHLLFDFYNTKVIQSLHTTHLLSDFDNTRVFKENKDINITFQNDNS
jgi:hypothetical protein